jgi:allatostatin receptor
MTVMMSVDDLTDFEAAIAVIVPVIFGLIAVLGFIGNLLVIVVVATSNRKRRSTTNILVSGLAVADLVFIIVCVPFTAVNFALGVWPFGTILCKVSLIRNPL